MADHTLHDEGDFTLCTLCHSSITPYDNTSLTRLSDSLSLLDTQFKSTPLTLSDLSATSHLTATLLSHRHRHCAKCGLHIEVHPSRDEEPDLSAKLFICSADATHNYCLCHHCGLLYGVNPNTQTLSTLTVDALSKTLRSKSKKRTERTEMTEITEVTMDMKVEDEMVDREVVEEEGDHSSSEASASKECVVANYHNERLQSLKRKLSELSSITGRASWPPSPSQKGIQGVGLSLNLRDIKDSPSAMSAATPSPPFLEIRDSSAKWRLAQSQMAENMRRKEKGGKGGKGSKGASAKLKGTKRKLKAQKARLEELEEMQRRMSRRKKVDTEELRKLLRSGQYPGAGRQASY